MIKESVRPCYLTPPSFSSPQDGRPPSPSAGRPVALATEGLPPTTRDTIRLIVRGSLGSCSSSSECLEDSTTGSVAETITSVLRGCLENMPKGKPNAFIILRMRVAFVDIRQVQCNYTVVLTTM